MQPFAQRDTICRECFQLVSKRPGSLYFRIFVHVCADTVCNFLESTTSFGEGVRLIYRFVCFLCVQLRADSCCVLAVSDIMQPCTLSSLSIPRRASLEFSI